MNIFIVDDNIASRTLTAAHIRRIDPLCHIVETGNAQETLAKARDLKHVDMVMVDDLEGLGLGLISDLKSAFPKAKIGLLTINSELDESAKELGLEFILKPVTADKLRQYFFS